MVHFSELDLHKMAMFDGENIDTVAALSVLAKAYSDMSLEWNKRKHPNAFKYNTLAKYWHSKFKDPHLALSLSDHVEYDAGNWSPQITKISVNSCFLTEAYLEKHKKESKYWSQFLDVLREQSMTEEQYINKYLKNE